MLTGEIRSQVDQIWNAFWTGGISNPIEVIEQITYLLFIKRLDELHTNEENRATTLKRPMERRVFPEGKDDKRMPYEEMRWSKFRNQGDPKTMYTIVSEHVFPFLRSMRGKDSTYSKHMEGARFTIPTPALLSKVVDMLDKVPMENRDTKGDLYEYMPGKIASAGQNGQFRTPRHIIQLMVEMTAPKPTDVVCDPASGTCGFLVAVGEYLRQNHKEVFRDDKLRKHFHEGMFHGYDFDNTMLRIGSMNMLLHGIENPDITYRDSLAQDHVLRRWRTLDPPLPWGEVASAAAGEGERARPRTSQSFLVPRSDIAAAGYDLSLNLYKEVVHEEVQHDPPKKILAELRKIEEEIERGMKDIEAMLQ